MNLEFNYLKDLCLPSRALLREVISVIDRGAAQIALITEQGRLVGTVTDGDIRRCLLRGESLDSPVANIMCRDFHYLPAGATAAEALAIMQCESLRQIPAIDETGKVVHLFLLDSLIKPQRLLNSVVIMAGGRGTRLLPHTEHCPKPLLPVAGRPMLEILLEQCIASGFLQFYFSVNYLKEQIIDHFGDGQAWGVSIDYLVEDEPLGTAGSLQLLPSSMQEPFLVLNGDVLTRLNPSQLVRFHVEHEAAATLGVREHITTVPFGVVQTKGVELAGFEEKPSFRQLVNAGVYVINPQLLPLLPPHQPTDMPTLLRSAQQAGHRVAVCPIHEYWIDVGRPETLYQAHQEWPLGAEP